MKLTLISPRIALQKGDFLGSGIPYWPLELATFASHARETGDEVNFIDLFGANPTSLTDMDDHYLQGVPIDNSKWRTPLEAADTFILYALSYMSHGDLLSITKWLKLNSPKKKLVVLENSQAVTAYSLEKMAPSFLEAGADLLICGEPYFNWDSIKLKLQSLPCEATLLTNIITHDTSTQLKRMTSKSTRYPIPAWDLVELKNYWRLPYSHGPKTKTFLPILTSRGCPYPCDFCVIPSTNNKLWRGNDPVDVVEEIITLRDRYDVHDFQVEDVNPTVQHQRWERICELLIERQANVRFYIVSGTKAETIHVSKIPLFAQAGCRYISISPESGSPELMKVIGKRFDKPHALSLIEACRKYKIRTQACFLVGHPAETLHDLQMSAEYISQLIKTGLDEVAVFVVAPFAGSLLYNRSAISLDNAQS
ncbi:MAG: B12-binding domain-containing radical SAM protein [Bdellovibrionaceae bacterium]|nr:B12-binding domain-containing radical SAM protein [Pseudobdellovibrionaceae bacterium]